MRTFVIVGGGITGLAAAWYAEKADLPGDIVLLERDSRLGGKIRTEYVGTEGGGAFVLEAGAESLLSRKAAGIELCRDMGIESRLMGTRPQPHGSFVSYSGKLYPVPSGFTGLVPGDTKAVMESELLSGDGKRRFLEEPTVVPPGIDREESIATFMTRRYGREVFERLIEPLAGGIYAGNAALLSIDATFPHLRERERRYGSLQTGAASGPPSRSTDGSFPPFVSFPGGMAELVESIKSRLRRTDLRLDQEVTGVQRRTNGTVPGHSPTHFVLETDGHAPVDAEAVMFATPAGEAGRLLAGIDPSVGDNLSRISYASSVIVNIAFAESDTAGKLEGYGYVIPSIEGGVFTACTWSSSKWELRAPPGSSLIRLYAGRFGNDAAMKLSDEELVACAQEELERSTRVVGRPLFSRVHRWQQAIPQYNVGHLERVRSIRERERALPGIVLAGAPFAGVGIPDCIATAREAVDRVVGHLRSQ